MSAQVGVRVGQADIGVAPRLKRNVGGPALKMAPSTEHPSTAHYLSLAVQRKGLDDVSVASPTKVGNQGFSGGGGEIPHRAEMEQSFGGVDFSGVRAHTGSAASQANESLSASAYTMGNQVAFKTANPSKALVAHELTHVLQQTNGVERRAAGAAEIDTSGESEAVAVERAVESGRSASTALTGSAKTGGLARKVARSGTTTSTSGDTGLMFNIEGDKLQSGGAWTIWGQSTSFPTPIPGLNILVQPSLQAIAQSSISNGGDAEIQVGITGGVLLGPSLGIANGIEGYIAGGLAVNATAAVKRINGVRSFELEANLQANARLGVKLLGRPELDFGITLASVKILRALAKWTQGSGGWRYDRAASGLSPGEDMEGIWNTFRAVYNRLVQVKNGVVAVAESAVRMGRGAAHAASDLYDWATSW